MKKGIKQNYIDMLIQCFVSAKADLQDCWNNPVAEQDVYDGTWRFGADPETKQFCKMIQQGLSENLTFAETVSHVRDSNSLEQLYWNIKCSIAVDKIPDIG